MCLKQCLNCFNDFHIYVFVGCNLLFTNSLLLGNLRNPESDVVVVVVIFISGVRTEQDLYARLIDSVTKQVGHSPHHDGWRTAKLIGSLSVW
jgi:hypothetical protein